MLNLQRGTRIGGSLLNRQTAIRMDGRTDGQQPAYDDEQINIYIPFKLYMITQIHLSCLKSFTSQLGLGSGSSNRHKQPQQPVLKRDLYS